MYQTVICLDLPSPAGSSDLPGQCGSIRSAGGPPVCPVRSCFGWGLHMPRALPRGRWSLAPPLHPYRPSGRRLFSVALSWESPPPDVGLSSPAAFRLCSRDRPFLSAGYLTTIPSSPQALSFMVEGCHLQSTHQPKVLNGYCPDWTASRTV